MNSTLITPRIAPKKKANLAQRARETGMNANHWYPAAFSEEVKRGKVIETTYWGDSIALYRAEDGGVHALENRCPHRHIKLSHGSVEGCQLVCLYHGWTFNPEGALTGMKHDTFGKPIPKVGVRSYPVRERYGIVWVFPGDPELATKTPLVEIPHAEGEGRWASLHFAYTWRAHHSMVIDNLCNLTHLWVHGSWVPYAETVLADSSVEGDRITLTWRSELRRDWMHPVTGRYFREAVGSNKSDTFMVYDYPYQSALSNRRVRSCNFMLPIDDKHTKVFSLQLWQPTKIPFTNKRWPYPFAQAMMPFIKPVTMEIFRQDGFTVEEEQVAYDKLRPSSIPELNPMVKRFNELSVRKWEEYLAYQRDPKLTDEQLANQMRPRVL